MEGYYETSCCQPYVRRFLHKICAMSAPAFVDQLYLMKNFNKNSQHEEFVIIDFRNDFSKNQKDETSFSPFGMSTIFEFSRLVDAKLKSSPGAKVAVCAEKIIIIFLF